MHRSGGVKLFQRDSLHRGEDLRTALLSQLKNQTKAAGLTLKARIEILMGIADQVGLYHNQTLRLMEETMETPPRATANEYQVTFLSGCSALLYAIPATRVLCSLSRTAIEKKHINAEFFHEQGFRPECAPAPRA